MGCGKSRGRSITCLWHNRRMRIQRHVPTGVFTNQRPRSVTVVGSVFVAAGAFGLAYHATELRADGPVQYGVVWVLCVRVLAVVAGVFILRGAAWARWLALVWTAYQVIVSAFHSVVHAVVHILVFAGVAYVLFRAEASAYFRGATPHVEEPAADV